MNASQRRSMNLENKLFFRTNVRKNFKQHRAFFFCKREKNKTMYLLKLFSTDTLVSIKLKENHNELSKILLRWVTRRNATHFMLVIGVSTKRLPQTPKFIAYKQACAMNLCRLGHSHLNTGQVTKGAGRMPWHQEPKKDAISCEKLRVGANIH